MMKAIVMLRCVMVILAGVSISAFSGQFHPSLLNRHAGYQYQYQYQYQYRNRHEYNKYRSTSLKNNSDDNDTENDVATETDDDGTTPAAVAKEEVESTEDEMAEMIEVSFVQACLQLAKGYVDVQKLFLAAVKANYDRRISLPNLVHNVQDCPARSANRDLTDEEVDVRTTSMALVYLTLHTLDRLSEDDLEDWDRGVPKEILDTYGDTVEVKVRGGLGMEPLESLSATSSTGDPTQDALTAHYGTAVIGLTITVADEEEACDGDGLKPRQPRPPIPGTS